MNPCEERNHHAPYVIQESGWSSFVKVMPEPVAIYCPDCGMLWRVIR